MHFAPPTPVQCRQKALKVHQTQVYILPFPTLKVGMGVADTVIKVITIIIN